MDIKNYKNQDEWAAEGYRVFGTEDRSKWAFKCPTCGRKQTQDEFKEYKDKGANPGSFSTECLGRYTGGKKGPHKCDWAAYGLFAGPSFVADEDGERVAIFNFWEEK